mmetsp:Transcript_16849/g.31910  ORF Transcript_16849/g.31910 Transcript_16849/m.31910 type:complete len:399 (-) Transcript_16849:184-1380(-)
MRNYNKIFLSIPFMVLAFFWLSTKQQDNYLKNISFQRSSPAAPKYEEHNNIDVTGTTTDISSTTMEEEDDDDEENKIVEEYSPAPMEQWIMDNIIILGWDDNVTNPDSCSIFHNQTFAIYNYLHQYIKDLANYHSAVDNYHGFDNNDTEYKDLRLVPKNKCDIVRLQPEKDGLQTMFHGQLSKTNKGFVEPLLTPMRHPMFCFTTKRLMDMKYMIHDFEAICKELKPSSRTVLIDMGASLDFHAGDVPIYYLLGLYKRFGINFDHIYAFEMRKKDPEAVYKAITDEFMASYHWINVGVSPEEGNKLNPFHSILRQFNKDDFIVVKLDVDTASVEVPLAYQLLNDKSIRDLVDQFYFEHHVHASPINRFWSKSARGSIKDSFELFTSLRKNGIPSHFWP